MKAIILAAGRGTRVRPLTHTIPKPMLPIINKPVMEFLVQLLERHGARQIVVNTSYLANAIESYFGDGASFGVEMAYSFEGFLENGQLVDRPLGSAGALKKIQEHSGFFDETFVVLCGDALIDVDLSRLLRFHRQRGALATIGLAAVPRDQLPNYGVVAADRGGRILEFQEKPRIDEARSTTVNTGIYVFEPEVIDHIPSGVPYDIGGQLFPKLVSGGLPLYGAQLPLQWLDIGKVADYYRVLQLALRGRVRGLPMPGTQIAPGIWSGLNTRLELSQVEITPPVYLGGGAVLEPGCRIAGPTMIGPGCIVESGACIERSAIFAYTRVGPWAYIKDAIICGGYWVDSSGTIIDLGRSGLDWLIADSRGPQETLSAEQQQFVELLEQEGPPAERRPLEVYAA